MSDIYIYWDESHFWGLMMARAMKAWSIPHRLIRATEIAQGALADKPDALVVPGGRARAKAERLGPNGMDAVREYVRAGGTYVGFCGGTGLALAGGHGLGICPWTRHPFTNRLHHFLNGHIHVNVNQGPEMVPECLGDKALVPVWWPGRFSQDSGDVEVLARYDMPGPDFWVADLNLNKLPAEILNDWEALYGIQLRPDFLKDEPCVISGDYGKGRYFLSYAHLETPASPRANSWLSYLLGVISDGNKVRPPIPAWDVANLPIEWDDQVLARSRLSLEGALAAGQSNFLLFWRAPWLIGWRRGIPGASINSLYSLICESMTVAPNERAMKFWASRREEFDTKMGLLCRGLTGLLLAERLSMTVLHTTPDAVPGLKRQRVELFGPPLGAGGLYADLIHDLEELYHLLNQPPLTSYS